MQMIISEATAPQGIFFVEAFRLVDEKRPHQKPRVVGFANHMGEWQVASQTPDGFTLNPILPTVLMGGEKVSLSGRGRKITANLFDRRTPSHELGWHRMVFTCSDEGRVTVEKIPLQFIEAVRFVDERGEPSIWGFWNMGIYEQYRWEPVVQRENGEFTSARYAREQMYYSQTRHMYLHPKDADGAPMVVECSNDQLGISFWTPNEPTPERPWCRADFHFCPETKTVTAEYSAEQEWTELEQRHPCRCFITVSDRWDRVGTYRGQKHIICCPPLAAAKG